MSFFTLSFVVALCCVLSVWGCTNIVVSPGASTDSSSMIAYNADASTLFGELYHYPAADHAVGSMRNIYDWDSGSYLGQIPEVSHTYNVVGNVNEFGLVIGETTFGGVENLQSQSAAKVDYGSLIWLTLQRSKTAREAIKTIASLVSEYGYASEGESFSIADPLEAWILEIIGKGEYELGAVWVAQRVPDGYVTAHANQARIRTFPLNDPENCMYSQDVISFARKIGLYDQNQPDSEFSFSDVYDPVTFSGARICDARVWSVFSSLMGSDWSNQYLDYAMGYNLTNRMPLFVKPANNAKVSLTDAMDFMRSHYEGTALDMTGTVFSDVGATESNPFRAHPLTWNSKVTPDGSSGDKPLSYMHERPIATPQTGWNFVAQSRRFVPRELAGLLWFGVDDSSTTVRFPIYGSSTRVPEAFGGKGPQDGVTPPMMKFSFDSAFYVFNLVANWAYSRWDLIYPDVLKAIQAKETQYMTEVKEIDQKAITILDVDGPAAAIDYVTNYSVNTGNKLVKDWLSFFGDLFVKYRDGYVITANPTNTACGCSSKNAFYPQAWYDRIVKDTGSHYLVLPDDALKNDPKIRVLAKKNLKAMN
jgi:dipeptidase